MKLPCLTIIQVYLPSKFSLHDFWTATLNFLGAGADKTILNKHLGIKLSMPYVNHAHRLVGVSLDTLMPPKNGTIEIQWSQRPTLRLPRPNRERSRQSSAEWSWISTPGSNYNLFFQYDGLKSQPPALYFQCFQLWAKNNSEQIQRICTGFINHVLGSKKSAKNISTYQKKSLQDFIGCLHNQ